MYWMRMRIFQSCQACLSVKHATRWYSMKQKKLSTGYHMIENGRVVLHNSQASKTRKNNSRSHGETKQNRFFLVFIDWWPCMHIGHSDSNVHPSLCRCFFFLIFPTPVNQRADLPPSLSKHTTIEEGEKILSSFFKNPSRTSSMCFGLVGFGNRNVAWST